MRPLFFILLIGFGLVSNAQDFDYLPEGPGELVEHHFFTLGYSEDHEQAYWVAYSLNYKQASPIFERTDDFRQDPKVSSGSAAQKDYTGSGFDRGHLCPAGDMAFSDTAMTESFYFSNMSPQNPSFNRGIWKRLEAQVRSWAVVDSQIYVVTGPVLRDSLKTIGDNQVAIPEYYYKVILCPTEQGYKTMGFLLPNEKNSSMLQKFAVSIDSVENVTGIDFFASIDDEVEDVIESTVNQELWAYGLVAGASTGARTATPAGKCQGITKKNKRCKKSASTGSEYCWQHQSQAPKQCIAITGAGKQCSRMAKGGNEMCWQHE